MYENLRTWDLVLPTAEFAYNSSINRTIRMSPFEVVYGYETKQLIDLILMAPHHTRMSELAASFASHNLDLHKDCLLYTSPSPRDRQKSRMPSSA